MVFELEEEGRGDGGVDDARRGVLTTWLTAPSCPADAETGREEKGGSVEMKGARRPGLWEDSGGEIACCIIADICGTESRQLHGASQSVPCTLQYLNKSHQASLQPASWSRMCRF